MDKLHELLNEFHLQKGAWVKIDGPEEEISEKEEVALEATLISKKYGFIKWLVENDKIDYEKLCKEGFIVRTYDLDEIGESFDYVERLLMLLTIQDEPLEFLSSILK